MTRRFVADMTLGKLARWLRLLGFDTVVRPEISAAVEDIREGRFPLSRNRSLDRLARGKPHLVIQSDRVPDQLREVFAVLQTPAEKLFSSPRCSLCNAELVRVDRRAARFLVAEYVFRRASRFGRCPQCDRIYWPGTHRQQMTSYLKQSFPHPMTT